MVRSPASTSRLNTLYKLTLFLQHGILLLLGFGLLIYFEMETGSGTTYLLPAVLVGWMGFYWSPERYKPVFYFLPFFGLLFYAFGIICAMLFLGFAAFFVFWIFLPFPKWIRVLGILAIVAFLFLNRIAYFGMPRIGLIVPFLATAFMFRWLIYLQEFKYKKITEPYWIRLAYFLQPANLVFLLYPIIDYRKFVQSYDLSNYSKTLSVAIERLFRSVFHFLIYRLIYFYVIIPYSEVQNSPAFLIYACAGYMLILRISSIYYLCLSCLGFFGFNLPDVFNFYFLPTGFTQLWARINIYWREFIMRIFYYPFYFKIRKRFGENAIWMGSLYCFVATFFMHFYQLFWLRGILYPKWNDLIYWMVIGTGVTTTVYLLQKKKIKAFRPSEFLFYPKALVLAMRIVFMFLLMSFLWVLWQCNTFSEWTYMMQKLTLINLQQTVIIFLILIAIVLIGPVIWLAYEKKFKSLFLSTNYIKWIIPLVILAAALKFSSQKKWINAGNLHLAFSNELNLTDKQNIEQGYYDQVISKGGDNKLPWEMYVQTPMDWSQLNGATWSTNNVLLRELKPKVKVTYNGASIITNEYGMRDRTYSIKKPQNTIRFALIGGSYEVGSGVENHEIYEKLTEDALNKNDSLKVEILNFSLGGYYLPQAIFIADEKAPLFEPDYIIYAAHEGEFERIVSNYSRMVVHGIDLKFDYMHKVKKECGVRQYMSRNEIKNRVYPKAEFLLNEGYKTFAANCRKRNIQPVWMYVPALKHKINEAEKSKIMKVAQRYGFITIDLSAAFTGFDHNSLMVAPNDNHPNAKGHILLHKQMLEYLQNIISLRSK